MENSTENSFSRRFTAAWQAPTAERLASLLADDVVLYQPHLPPIRGKAAAQAEFERLLSWIPGTFSKVKVWREDESVALIEHELHFPVGTGFIRVRAVDRFNLEQGLGKERVVYFNLLRLIGGVLKHPSLWWGYLKYRFSGRARPSKTKTH